MNKMGVILSKISKGKTSDDIAKELGMRKDTVRAMIESMIYLGYIEEVICRTGCSLCPMKCSSQSSDSKTKMYVITREGTECIKGS